jgi:hypothetical protein
VILAWSHARGGGESPPPVQPAASSAPDGALEVGAFSTAGGSLPAGWVPLEFRNIERHTRYTLVQGEGGWTVRAESHAAASGLIRRGLSIDLREHPIVRWRWRVDRLIARSDPALKAGDDYAARIYIAFRYEADHVPLLRKAKFKAARLVFGDLPIGAINYIWATATPVGSIVDNPFAGDFVKMIPVQSGSGAVGRWVEQERNVYEDYKLAFGAEPPLVEGVAFMTDTDNTGESATASYGDILFLRAKPR